MHEILEFLAGERAAVEQRLSEWLQMPSISADPGQAAAVRACAAHTADLLRASGVPEVALLPTEGGPPVVYGHWPVDPAQPSLLIYGHYDVQPVDPLELWDSPPFAPVVHDDRIWARGSADDKGQVLILLQAVRAWHQTRGAPPVNLKFLLEGEEEIGSPHLPAWLHAHRERLEAEVALVADTSLWAIGVPAITTSLRGLVALEVRVRGPNRDLHSGSFGGAVDNPLEVLARLLASAKDAAGRVVIPGFHDGIRPLTAAERAELARIPFDPEAWRAGLGLAAAGGDSDYGILERLWRRPTFEINGLWGGFQGTGAKTVLPAEAHAKISCRLAPGQSPEAVAAAVRAFLLAQAPPTVQLDIQRLGGSGEAFLVDPQTPGLAAARRGLREAYGTEPLAIGEGGSIPIVAAFRRMLGIQTLLIGFSLPDSRAHSPNENLHLPTFHRGTEAIARMLYYLRRE